MGNFSVNHYARIQVGQPATEVLFVLDLAELPSFELMQRWGLTAASPHAELEKRAIAEARIWTRQLQFIANGKPVAPAFRRAELAVSDGAGGLPVMRVSSYLRVAAAPGMLVYKDGTYPDRTAGWKEVVVVPQAGAELAKSSAGAIEKSQALTAYPQDPTLSPPQDLEATVLWRGAQGAVPVAVSEAVRPEGKEVLQPDVKQADVKQPDVKQRDVKQPAEPSPVVQALPSAPLPTAAKTGSTVAEPHAAGQVQRGDYLSKALQGKEIGWGVGLVMVFVAFWFGALHALEPGHGKTMVAAYLVGERGTPKHALLLGGMVTFTHTVSVFVLGLLTMFLSQYIMPDVVSKWLGVISGLTILWIGGMLLYQRARSLGESPMGTYDYGQLITHSHGGSTHSHGFRPAGVSASENSAEVVGAEKDQPRAGVTADGEISMKSLMALGASGGLVPCPSALVLLLAAVSVGRIGFGLLLLVSFSLGLALVLMATGLVVLYAKRFLPKSEGKKSNALFRFMPVASAALIFLIGVVLTGNALGLIPAIRFFG